MKKKIKLTEQESFDLCYNQIRDVYEGLLKEGASPTEIFGVMLGVIAQEFKAADYNEGFNDLLKMAMSQVQEENSSKGHTIH